MPWVRLDEHAMEHPKVAGLPDGAFRLWVVCLAHCQKFLTDGFIPEKAARGLRTYSPKRLAELVSAGLLDTVENGFQVHDYLDWNESRSTVLENRDWGKRRRELYADPGLLAHIRERDRDCCRYCGKPVNWRDRRGPDGGTYDHVIARGPNTAENVVVACRGCNAAKGDKPLESCGMRLLSVPELDRNQVRVRPHIGGVGDVGGTDQSVRHSERGPGKTAPDADAVNRFVERYRELHEQYRGVAYLGNPQKDYQAACEMVAAFGVDFCEAIAIYGLNDRDPFMQKGTVTLTILKSRASKYAEELKAKRLA